MNKPVVILAAGRGNKMHPFSSVRSKTAIKIAGIPLILYNIDSLIKLGCKEIIIVTRSEFERELTALVSKRPGVKVTVFDTGLGSADSFIAGAAAASEKSEGLLALYGDTIIGSSDLERLWSFDGTCALTAGLMETSRNWIGASVDGGKVSHIGAHERGDRVTHAFAGFSICPEHLQLIIETPDYFPDVKVGVGTPRERFLEAGLLPLVSAGELNALECTEQFLDIDKPWHMLAANRYMVSLRCASLAENSLGEGSAVSPGAEIEGYVNLGKNSYIGKGVVIKGSLIAGDDTIIENGTVFEGDAVIGDGTIIRNFCKLGDGVSIGSNCVIDHGAELIGGMFMDKVYFYHYGEFFGAAGNYVDFGAGTVCGTLRFDDSEAAHKVGSRRETPLYYANACYVGDYCRTGVGSMLMPGCTVGPYSVVGPGVLLEDNLPERSMVRLKQEHIITPWGEDRYGW